MAAIRHLGFLEWNFKLCVGFRWSMCMRHCAKFPTERSNRCWDSAIFLFFCKIAAVHHLGFVMCTL